MKHWYEEPMRVFDLALEDPCDQWLDRWTAQDLIRSVRDVHANVVDMMIVNEWGQAYFKAGQLPEHPQLNGTDRLAEVIDEAKKHNLRVLGMWGPTPNPILYERHPDWAKRSSDGEVSGWGYPDLDPCVHVCHNSPYGALVLETLDELFRGYAIDGVAFDYFLTTPCYCRYCRDKFLQERGLDLDARGEWTDREDRALSAWAAQDGDDFMARAAEVADRHDRIIVTWQKTGHVLFNEPHTGGLITLQDKGFCIRRTTACARARKIPTVICTPYAHLYYIGTSKPAPHMRQEFREIVISGASPWVVIWDWEYVKDKRGLTALETVFKEVENHEAYMTGSESFKYAALLVSDQAADLFGEEAYRHSDPARGWYDALTRAHIPVDVILDGELTPEDLSPYRVLILANAASLSAGQAEAVKTFVSEGGGLVASHKTSLYDVDRCERDGFALREVFGCEFRAVIDDPWTYIGFPRRHPIAKALEKNHLVVHGEMKSLEARLDPELPERMLRGMTLEAWQQLEVAPQTGSKVVATIFDTARPLGSYFLKDLAPALPGNDTGNPAAVVNRYGDGTVVYFPGQVDRLFYRIGHPDHERLLLNSLLFAGGKPALSVKAPTTVESTFFRQPKHRRIIIHLLNHTYDQLYPRPTTGGLYGTSSRDVVRPIGDIIPVSGVRVSFQAPEGAEVRRVFSACTGKELPHRLAQGEVRVRVPKLAEYDVLVIEHA